MKSLVDSLLQFHIDCFLFAQYFLLRLVSKPLEQPLAFAVLKLIYILCKYSLAKGSIVCVLSVEKLHHDFGNGHSEVPWVDQKKLAGLGRARTLKAGSPCVKKYKINKLKLSRTN